MYRSTTQLFTDAKTNGGAQFLFTLVRATGWERCDDGIRSFANHIKKTREDIKSQATVDYLGILKSIVTEYETFSLIANLVRNALGENYRIQPLSKASNELGMRIMVPENGRHIDELNLLIKRYETKNPEFYKVWNSCFGERLKSVYSDKKEYIDDPEFRENIESLLRFLFDFHKRYFRFLNTFSQTDRFRHLPYMFTVIELTVDKQQGLYGFVAHHSDGSQSSFHRYHDHTEQMNYSFTDEGEIAISVGSVDRSQPLWLVKGKPFYEIGCPGRYNPIGKWKPIVYPGNANYIQAKCHELTKDEPDKRVEGCLFYIMATCNHAIEFVVKTNFEIPGNYIGSKLDSMRIQLNKVNMPDEASNHLSNTNVYDGTLLLPDMSNESVKEGLDAIGFFINRLAFRVDGKADWKLKYSVYSSSTGRLNLSHKNINALGDFMSQPIDEDAYLLDTAMGWYRAGKNSTNIFSEFLSYYIAFESLAMPLVNGQMKASSRFGIEVLSPQEKKEQIKTCILSLHETEYKTEDPQVFIEKAYFECVKSLTVKTRQALSAVFGNDHAYVSGFFDKSEGKSIYLLRNDLAHGNFNHIDREHAILIEKKMPVLKEIVFAFIMKITTDNVQNHKKFNRYSLMINMSDPRGTMVTNNLSVLPRSDWSIRWEWLD